MFLSFDTLDVNNARVEILARAQRARSKLYRDGAKKQEKVEAGRILMWV